MSFYFNPVTSITSAVIIWVFVGLCVRYPKASNDLMKEIKDWVTDKWTWLYVVTQDVWAIFIIALYFSKYSNLRLGKNISDRFFQFSNYGFPELFFLSSPAFYSGVVAMKTISQSIFPQTYITYSTNSFEKL